LNEERKRKKGHVIDVSRSEKGTKDAGKCVPPRASLPGRRKGDIENEASGKTTLKERRLNE